MLIRPCTPADEGAVIALWQACGLTRPWNDPRLDFARKMAVQPELFLAGVLDGRIVASVMAGYDGHRGWMNYLAVDPAHRGRGLGAALVRHIEQALVALGCPKLNLQIRADNAAVGAFYARLGYAPDAAFSWGRRLIEDGPGPQAAPGAQAAAPSPAGLRLMIGNKNYSSWSMRPWVLMRQAGIDFEEVMVRFDGFGPESTFKRTIVPVNPAGTVPVLIDGDLVVPDTLAIAEYLAERFPQHGLWPADARARAQARSACARMHAGFQALRSACPMNIEASLPEIGALLWRDRPAVREDVAAIEALWTDLLREHGGPMLFGAFSIADAYYAPVCLRLRGYRLPVSETVNAYIDRVLALPGVRDWLTEARAERDFLDFEEPYRLNR
jgi:glutathione S-transferase